MERVEEQESELQQAVRAAIADARAERERLEQAPKPPRAVPAGAPVSDEREPRD